jgi:hypothetical protein
MRERVSVNEEGATPPVAGILNILLSAPPTSGPTRLTLSMSYAPSPPSGHFFQARIKTVSAPVSAVTVVV